MKRLRGAKTASCLKLRLGQDSQLLEASPTHLSASAELLQNFPERLLQNLREVRPVETQAEKDLVYVSATENQIAHCRASINLLIIL